MIVVEEEAPKPSPPLPNAENKSMLSELLFLTEIGTGAGAVEVFEVFEKKSNSLLSLPLFVLAVDI